MIDVRLSFEVCGYVVAIAAMSYSLIAAFVVRRPIAFSPAECARRPTVTILKPLCGAEPETYECLRSFCEQDYPDFQIVFGVSDPADPAVAIVQRLQSEYPERALHLVAERRLHGSNRKVSNLINMMAVAHHEYLIISDSDVRVESDYIERVIAPLGDKRVGIVTCCYRGVPREGVWSNLGAMFINNWFIPSVRVAALLGFRSFAFGATIAIRREVLSSIGGFTAIVDQLADDYRLGELTRRLGLRTVLSDVEVETIVAERSVGDLISHELRWRKTIRMLAPSGYRFSFLTMGLPVTALQIALTRGAAPAFGIFGVTVLSSTLLHFGVGKDKPMGATGAKLLLVPLRDLLHFGLWGWSFATRRVQWREDHYHVTPDGTVEPVARV
ncbi:MAG TPA: bacteriohopanetetrol glucosamine biosynthesis glycosyltransferase HpnI [Steroidobacteraceae bacterium]|jgi:ceramide glucosyltransferase